MTALALSADGLCLEVRGAMTVCEVPSLLAGLNEYPGVLYVDLKAVERVDSSALTMLIELGRRAAGHTVTVYHAPPALRALSDLYGLQTLFWVV